MSGELDLAPVYLDPDVFWQLVAADISGRHHQSYDLKETIIRVATALADATVELESSLDDTEDTAPEGRDRLLTPRQVRTRVALEMGQVVVRRDDVSKPPET